MDEREQTSHEGVVTRVLRQAVEEQPVEEGQFRADLKRRLFGGPVEPITLDRYVVLARLAAGGAGVVYRAYDPELDRRVAIKLLNPRPGSSELETESRTRLLREAQAMAQLAHPNVIAVHDVGTYEGNEVRALQHERGEGGQVPREGVFIVMELVPGPNLAEWLSAARRSWREVLEVFVAAGRGLAAAHARGLIHRDFKPANVIVGTDGRVRVLDFGLARLQVPHADHGAPEAHTADVRTEPTSDRALLGSDLTLAGTIMGTPAYMAPEQHRGEAPDERVDQYAFCAALYQGLFGELPFSARGLRELETQKAAGAVLPRAGRRVVPAWLGRAVLRGLSPDPAARHDSMETLLRELSRGLRPRWHWAALGTGVALTAGLALALARPPGAVPETCRDGDQALAGVWDAARRTRVREAFEATSAPFADAAHEVVDATLNQYIGKWTELRDRVCSTGTGETEDLARQSQQLLCLERRLTRARALTEMFAEADAKVVEHAAEAVAALPPMEPCLASGAGAAADLGEGGPEALAAVDELLARAEVLRDAASYPQGLEPGTRALAEARRLGHVPTEIRAGIVLGELYLGAGQPTEAEVALDEAHRLAESVGSQELALASLVSLIDVIGLVQARHAEGERLALMARARLEYRGISDALDVRLALLLGRLRLEQGKYPEAVETLEEARTLAVGVHGPQHLRVADTLNAIGNVLHRQGKHEEAQERFERALEIREARLGSGHPGVGSVLNNLASLHRNMGRYDDALAEYRRALSIHERALGPEHPWTADLLVGMAIVLQDLGRSGEALATNERALAIRERVLDPDHHYIAQSHDNIGILLNQMGRHEEAVAHQEHALEIRQRSLGPEHPDVALTHNNLAYTLIELGRHPEALDHLERALAMREKILDPDHPDIVWSRANLGDQLLRMGRRARAAEMLELAVTGGSRSVGEQHAAVVRARTLLDALHADP